MMAPPIARTRIAHPTDDLTSIRRFYGDALGLRQIAAFDHEGYSGIVYAFPDETCELEFTLAATPGPKTAWSDETLLVLYIESRDAYAALVDALDKLPARRVASANPYWDRGGVTFLDPDGRRVVISRR